MSNQKGFFPKSIDDRIKDNLTSSYYQPINLDSITKSSEEHSKVDCHIHSKFSLDACMDIQQIVDRAITNDVEFISITDHNNAMAFHSLMKSEHRSDKEIFFNYDGVKILSGCELNCTLNVGYKKNAKLHMLLYGFDGSPNSPIMQMIEAKNDSYKASQLARVYHLINKNKSRYKTDLTELNNYVTDLVADLNKNQNADPNFKGGTNFSGNMDKSSIVSYYEWKGVPVDQIEEDLRDFQFVRDTQLDVRDVIEAVHASNGYCVVAHPTASYYKFFRKENDYTNNNFNIDIQVLDKLLTDKLLQIGVDGVELSNSQYEEAKVFNAMYSQNTFIRSCGTDVHYLTDRNAKDIGKFDIDVSSVNIDKVAEELNSARILGKKTDRQKQYANIQTKQSTFINFEPYLER